MRTMLTVVLALAMSGCAGEPGWIDDRFFVRTDDGTDLYVHAVGDSTTNDYVLFLHGGPGGGSSSYELAPSAPTLHDKLVMVYLDQRGQGASEGRTRPEDLTLPMLADDVVLVMDVLDQLYMADRVGEPRLWLMGHSWGGLLGPQVLLETDAADSLAGWIEVAGAHDIPKLHADSIDMLIEAADGELEGKLDEDTEAAWKDIRTTASKIPRTNPSLEELLELNDLAHSASDLIEAVVYEKTPGSVTFDWLRHRPNSSLANLTTGRQVADALLDKEKDRSWSERYRELTLPTMLLWGRYDFVVPPTLGEDVQLKVAAETVDLVILEDSAHFPMFTEPDAYTDAILDFIAEAS